MCSSDLGEALVSRLLSKNYHVRILDLNPPGITHKNLSFFQGDIRDEQLVLKACEGIDTVYHNVAQVPLAKNKTLFNSVIIGGMERLLSACKIQRVKKVIYTSSSAVFGVPESNPVTEEMIPKPRESYGRAKLEAETLCKLYVEKGLDISIIRPRTILGHGRLGIFQLLFEWIRLGRNIPVLGSGDNLYQFVH